MSELTLSSRVFSVEVAVPLPVDGAFSYLVPESLQAKARPGVRVLVPFRNREITGYVVGQSPESPDLKLKNIIAVLDDLPVISSKILALTRWVADYYASSWGEAIENALPRWVKYGKKAERALGRQNPAEGPASEPASKERTLSADQARAFEKIQAALEQETPKPLLLFGVTGSGKSEIYIRAIREILKRNRSAICMVPEIALTEQLRLFFRGQFGHQLEILHSRLTDGERFLTWKKIETGQRRVVLGPRSAVFAPLPDLGLIILDEEHEGSYKQETAPRYHAREVAAWRARHEGALFVMGSATPSLETMEASERGEIERVDLPFRIDEKALPAVQVLDLKQAVDFRKKTSVLSPRMASEIEANLRKKEGTLLLLNRRGFSTHITCPKCGTSEQCKSCQVSLTFHQEEETLLCHYCNYRKPVPSTCSQCGADYLRFSGFGTEKVESEVARRFPSARIARLDADSVRKRGSHEQILSQFREQKIDVLIGTQMIAKGFDFPHVTFVGVILADVGLMLPDFRAAERTFQLLTQVAGRAGRGKVPGRVLVQTFSPDHPSIQFARRHDYVKFYQHETRERQQYRYPPFCRLINVILRSRTEKSAYLFARSFRDRLLQDFSGQIDSPGRGDKNGIEIIGPAQLPFYKLRGHYRWHVMIKAPCGAPWSSRLKACLLALKKPSGVAYAIDVDPLNIL